MLSSVSSMEQVCQRLQQTYFLRGSGGLRGPPEKKYVYFILQIVHLCPLATYTHFPSVGWLVDVLYADGHGEEEGVCVCVCVKRKWSAFQIVYITLCLAKARPSDDFHHTSRMAYVSVYEGPVMKLAS